MTFEKKKLTFDFTVKITDVILILTLITGLLFGYFRLSTDVNKNSEWVEYESKPFHRQTGERLNDLDTRQKVMIEQLGMLNETLKEIKDEIKEFRKAMK